MSKTLTVSIAAYNTESTLERCLQSLAVPELFDDIEVIVVNDGSKDNTLEIARYYEKRFPNVFFTIDKENGGHGSTINASIDVATGKYYKVLDSDDTYEEEGLISLIKELKQTDADMLFSPYQTINVETVAKEYVDYLRHSISDNMFNTDFLITDSLGDNLRIALAAVTYRTELLKKSRYRLDEKCFYVDVEYAIYYLVNVKKIRLMKDIVYNYYVGSIEQSVNINNMIKRRDEHLFVCKNLILFYEKEKNVMNSINEKMIRVNIVNMILITEYRLLTTVNESKRVKCEIRSFDRFLKDTSPALYREIEIQGKLRNMKKIKLIVFFRKMSFYGFAVIHHVFLNKMIKDL